MSEPGSVPPAYQWYPKDALSSARIQRMSLEEEGAYRRLLDYQWLNGSIPEDLGQMARLCKGITKTRMQRIWDVIKDCFIPCPGGFMNIRLEKVRDDQRRHREERSASGKRGAEAKWSKERKDGSANGSAIKEPIAKNGSSSATATANSGEVKNTSPERTDAAYQVFVEAHQQCLDAIYVSKNGDFVGLAKLRKVYGVETRASPPGWNDAVRNYFLSPLGNYTLSDLCSRFAIFKNGALDRYGKPATGSREQERQQNAKQAARAALGEVDDGIQ